MSDGLARLLHLMRDHPPPKREHGFHKPVARWPWLAYWSVIVGVIVYLIATRHTGHH